VPELRQLAAHVSFLRTARDAPPVTELERAIADDPDNFEARFQLSAVHLVANDHEAAMQQLLEITSRGSGARHAAARDGLLALFDMLGDDDELVLRYRALLQETMH
jgi:putative thioredoxin